MASAGDAELYLPLSLVGLLDDQHSGHIGQCKHMELFSQDSCSLYALKHQPGKAGRHGGRPGARGETRDEPASQGENVVNDSKP